MELHEILARIDEVRARLADIERMSAPLTKELGELKESALELMVEQDLQAVGTDKATYSLRHSTFPMLEDAELFFAYAAADNWDLVRKQVNSAAWKERIEHGIEVPGVEVGKRVDLGIRNR